MRTLWPMLLAVVVGLSCAGLAQTQAPISPTPYYPLDKGNTWVYRAGKDTIRVRVVKHEVVGKVTCAVIEATEDRVKKIEYVSSLKDGIFRYKTKDKEIVPPLCLLKLPFSKKTRTWEVDSEVAGLKIKGTFKAAREKVTVLDKDYKAIKVECDELQIGERVLSLAWWFAPGVGVVKQRLRIGEFERVLELESYQIRKKEPN